MRFLIGMLVSSACIAAVTATANAEPTDAAPSSRELVLDGTVPQVATHPGRLVVLIFPEPVLSVLCSDQRYATKPDGNRVLIQPFSDASKQADLVVTLEREMVNFTLHIVESREDVTPRIELVREPRIAWWRRIWEPAESEKPAASTGARRLTVDPASRQTEWRVGGLFGSAVAGDPAMGAQTDRAYVTGASVNLAHRAGKYHGYDASLTLGHMTPLHFRNFEQEGFTGEMSRPAFLGRILVGASLRYGERIVPSLRLAGGLQTRKFVASRVHVQPEDFVMRGPGTDTTWDLAASLSAGLDIRLSGRWLLGIAIERVRTVATETPFDSIEGAIHVRWSE